MKEIVIEEVLEKLDNRFMLSVVAAKRARQLKDGAVQQVELSKEKDDTDLVIALDEINAGKIKAEIAPPETETAESLGAKIIEKAKGAKKKSDK
ncbi:MAG: DNA-directed RNA polymerase subunit omega [Candidatus Margulisbacteria bacterium]|jgi:DNA-directed RNA polymerase subunit omega|uniref:DNA-directed RNA polymerase subunit omega n=1 Tax=Termititenax aidoneus TaxID=2218524 RepID=A0A388TA74_TERA1|nr:DNA-directed RNA polymerase subunit omega [Candidatus Margulisiibacteriota bacterium]GBR73315.1 DNA-directed RNA polymerase subunit omega [Candidatus Termititenax aidoneus]